MPLKEGIQLIVQIERADGTFDCETYAGLPFTNPVYLAFCHAGTAASHAEMARLAAGFLNELWTTAGGHPVEPPCRGSSPTGCHALNEADCQKLLVLVCDPVVPLASEGLPLLQEWVGKDETFAILPVLPLSARTSAWQLLPPEATESNACFWTHAIGEVLPAVFATAGITAAQPRIFISYRQRDTAAAAMQLFDALSHDRFDVFLDHFRIAPGVNFQARLTQELGDKSMVLLLESQHLQDSQWVLYEINQAKACGLGVFALNFNGAPTVPGVDEGVRYRLTASDFVGGDPASILTPDAEQRVRGLVRIEHDRALIRRRIALEKSFEEAFAQTGEAPPLREANGAYRVRAPGKEYLAWLTTRPPELPDFHYVHGAARQPVSGVIIGLSRLMEPPRMVRNQWLARLCDLRIVDEGQLAWAAAQMARGAL